MTRSYDDPGARELARRLESLSSGKTTPAPDGADTTAETPRERLSRLVQLALNAAPLVLPVLGRLVPQRRPAGPPPRRRRFFHPWRLVRLSALATGLVTLGVFYVRTRLDRPAT